MWRFRSNTLILRIATVSTGLDVSGVSRQNHNVQASSAGDQYLRSQLLFKNRQASSPAAVKCHAFTESTHVSLQARQGQRADCKAADLEKILQEKGECGVRSSFVCLPSLHAMWHTPLKTRGHLPCSTKHVFNKHMLPRYNLAQQPCLSLKQTFCRSVLLPT